MVTEAQYKEAVEWLSKNSSLVASAKRLTNERNSLCSCSSGLKAKKCCLPKIDKLLASARNAELAVRYYEYEHRPITPIVELKYPQDTRVKANG